MDELPGADDNASGVAVLLELARILGAGHEPAVPTELVAYVLEEPPYFRTGLMGNAVHAFSLREAGVEVRAMLCLEMVGYFSSEPGSQGIVRGRGQDWKFEFDLGSQSFRRQKRCGQGGDADQQPRKDEIVHVLPSPTRSFVRDTPNSELYSPDGVMARRIGRSRAGVFGRLLKTGP